jgi:hypothetical protein
VGDFWSPELLAIDLRSGAISPLDLSSDSGLHSSRVVGLAASEDGTIYVSDGHRIWRSRPGASVPEPIAGEGPGF